MAYVVAELGPEEVEARGFFMERGAAGGRARARDDPRLRGAAAGKD